MDIQLQPFMRNAKGTEMYHKDNGIESSEKNNTAPLPRLEMKMTQTQSQQRQRQGICLTKNWNIDLDLISGI